MYLDMQRARYHSKALFLFGGIAFQFSKMAFIIRRDLTPLITHSERRPQNIYSQEEMNLYCIIKLETAISSFSLQISKT